MLLIFTPHSQLLPDPPTPPHLTSFSLSLLGIKSNLCFLNIPGFVAWATALSHYPAANRSSATGRTSCLDSLLHPGIFFFLTWAYTGSTHANTVSVTSSVVAGRRFLVVIHHVWLIQPFSPLSVMLSETWGSGYDTDIPFRVHAL